jgi:hypothetical protein
LGNVWQYEDPAKVTRALTVAMMRRDLDAALVELA